MATPICAAPPTSPDFSAVQALRRRCEAIITGELARLARRSPALGDGELDVVSTSIRHIVERLLLERARGWSSEQLTALFDLEETTCSTATTTTGHCTLPAAGTIPSCSIR